MRQTRGGSPAGLNTNNGTGVSNLSRGDSQDLVITDIISEGPIEGLATGLSSIYLNDDSVDNLNAASTRTINSTSNEPIAPFAANNFQNSPVIMNLTNGSPSFTLSNVPNGQTPIELYEDKDTYIIVRDAQGTVSVTLSIIGNSNTSPYLLTTASAFFQTSMIQSNFVATTNTVPSTTSIVPVSLISSSGEEYGGRLSTRNSSTTAEFTVGGAGAGAGVLITPGTYTLKVHQLKKVQSAGSNTTTGLQTGKLRRAVSDIMSKNQATNQAKFGNITWTATTATHFSAPQNLTSVSVPTENYFRRHTGWIGYFKPSQSGLYTFKLNSDDHSYLWIGDAATSSTRRPDTAIIALSEWGSTVLSEPQILEANVLYPIRITHSEESGSQYINFSWKSPSSGSFFTTLNESGHGVFYAPTVNDYRDKTTFTLASNFTGTTQSYNFDVLNDDVALGTSIENQQSKKYKSVIGQFRSGTRNQPLFNSTIGGNTAASISNAPTLNAPLEQNVSIDSTNGVATAIITGTSSVGFNLSAAQINVVDLVKLNFSYPGGLFQNDNNANPVTAYAVYKIGLALKDGTTGSGFGPVTILEQKLIHQSSSRNGVSFDYSIPLDDKGFFTDFQVSISRLTKHNGDGYSASNLVTPNSDNGQMNAQASIATVTSVILEKLTHPFTAMVRLSYNTKDFASLPKRTYLTRGLKIKVPSNYLGPLERGGGGTLASWDNPYRRSSNGSVSASYVDWDGTFRNEVYTDNPAWIYYDILTNNRYGLGDFLREEDIDKYQLYRIGRYCDEIVPDGKGSFEPRFRANFYFTKASDAYKVLKDMATTFRSMIYWIDGQIHPVIDQAKDPIYNFSKANVIEGKFTYETTGGKTKSNQVTISWNNPKNNYALEPLIVEDKLNIIETGKILRSSAVAFGCTSEGQARRFGKWKLWTALNQTEACSFSTSINASFLVPGDIINIQDSARYAKRYSGRISSTGTRSPSVVPLDSPVTLVAGNSYQLSVLIVEPGAFLAQDTATINSVTYSKGDLIKQAFIDSNGNGLYTLQDITSEDASVNAKAANNSTDALLLSWSEYTRVETQAVTVPDPAGSTSSITVSANFSTTPDTETIWVLVEADSNSQVLKESAKAYKVMSISQENINEYNISAIEHYNQKFDSVDGDFNAYVDSILEEVPLSTDIVPPITNMTITKVFSPVYKRGVKIDWDPPIVPASSFAIDHTIPNVENPVQLDGTKTSYVFWGVPTGSFSISVSSFNILQNTSLAVTKEVSILEDTSDASVGPTGLLFGAKTNTKLVMSSSGVLQFETANYELIPNNTNANRIVNTNLDASYYTQDVSTLANITEPVRTSDGEFLKTPHYIIFDADSVDQLKLIKYNDTDLSIPFWFNAGSGNTLSTALTSNSLAVWTNYTGNAGEATRGFIAYTQGSKKVTGFQTFFTQDLKVGDVLRIYGTEQNPFGIVSVIESNTVLFVETSITAATPSTNNKLYQRLLFRPDYINDVVLAYVYKTAAEGFKFKSFLTLESNLTAAAPSTTGLVHYIPCNSLSGENKLRDSIGAAIPTITGAGFSIDQDSPVGKSYVNTENDGVLLLTDAQADTWESNNWSVFLYINSSSTTTAANARVIERDSTKQWGIRLNQSSSVGSLQPLSFYFGGNNSDTPTQGVISPNRWYHVGIVYNGTNLTYFLDGFPVSTAAYNPTAADRVIALGCATTSATGISATTDNFLGKFSEIRFYNKNLTNEEVMGLAQLPGGGGIGSSVDPELLDSSGAQTAGSGNSVVTIDGGTDSNSSDNSTVYRLWAGHADPDSASFKVTDGGKVSLTSGAAHSIDLTATGSSLAIGANSTLTLPNDFISGNVIHGGEISGLTGLDISGTDTTFPVLNSPVFTITNTNTTPASAHLGGAIQFRHSYSGTATPRLAGTIASKYVTGTGASAEHSLQFLTGTSADIAPSNGTAALHPVTIKKIGAGVSVEPALGIGTVSPLKNVHVFSRFPTIRLESSQSGTGGIQFLGSGDSGSVKGTIEYSTSLNRLLVYTNAAAALQIDSSQNITAYGNLTGVVNFAYSGTFTGVANTINASYLVNGSTGDINILRNAATATKLAATKNFTVGGVNHAFDGSANIDLSEAVRDLVADFIVGGTNVTATHNDAGDSLTLAASGSGGSGIALTDLSVATEATPAGDGAISYNNSNGQFTYTPAVNITGNAATATALAASKDFTVGEIDHAFDGSANIDLSEAVRDLVAGFIVAGTNITKTHNDGSDTLTLAASGSGSSTFAGLSDTPGNFSGAGGKILKVNSGATAVEFGDLSLTDLSITDGSANQVLKTDGSGNFSFTNQTGGSGSGIAFTDLSVAAEATPAGDGAISYNNSNGQFTYTPPVDITGNAATATKLAASKTIGGVAFDGSANIDLPGVNADGNQNTTGNAATATALAASKDFTVGAVNHAFDGSANIDLSEAVRDLVAGFIVGGTNVTKTHNDAGNTLTLAVTSIQGGITGTEAAIPAAGSGGYGLFDDGSVFIGDKDKHLLSTDSGAVNLVGVTSEDIIGGSVGITEIIQFDSYKDDRFYPYYKTNVNTIFPMATRTYAQQSTIGKVAYVNVFGSTNPSSALRSAWDAKHLGSTSASGLGDNGLTMGTIPAKSFTYRPYLQFHGNIQVWDHCELRFQVQHKIDTGASVINGFNIAGNQFDTSWNGYVMTIATGATNFSTFNTNKSSYIGQDVTVVSNSQTLTLQISNVHVFGTIAYVYFYEPVTWFSADASATMTLPQIAATTNVFTNVGKEFRTATEPDARTPEPANFSVFFEDYVPAGADVEIRVRVTKYAVGGDTTNDRARRANEITTGHNWIFDGDIEGTTAGDDVDVISDFTMTAFIARGA